MLVQSANITADALQLIDEHLYSAYQRTQRCSEAWQQNAIAVEIERLQRERADLLADLLTALKGVRLPGCD